MKNTIILGAFLCLMCLTFTAIIQAQSARVGFQTKEGHGMAVIAQLDQDEDRQGPFQKDQDLPYSGSVQVDTDQPAPNPYTDDADLSERIESDYPSAESDTIGEAYPGTEPGEIPDDERRNEFPPSDEQYPLPDTDVTQEEYPTDAPPTGSTTTQPGIGAASGAVSQQTLSPKCDQASGHSMFRLTRAGINNGASFIRSGAQVEFWNDSNVTHKVVIMPSGILSNHAFTITPGSKVLVFAGSPGEITGGSIVANPGTAQTVHDIVICP